MSRYNDIYFVMSLPIDDGGDLILQAINQREEKKVWEMWISCLPHMEKEKFIPFDEFLDKCRPRQISQRPAEEILKEAEEITRRIKGR